MGVWQIQKFESAKQRGYVPGTSSVHQARCVALLTQAKQTQCWYLTSLRALRLHRNFYALERAHLHEMAHLNLDLVHTRIEGTEHTTTRNMCIHESLLYKVRDSAEHIFNSLEFLAPEFRSSAQPLPCER